MDMFLLEAGEGASHASAQSEVQRACRALDAEWEKREIVEGANAALTGELCPGCSLGS